MAGIDVSALSQKAERLRALHHTGRILVLPNIWDPGGARMMEWLGYPAVATASAAIAYSQGYDDGQQITLEAILDIVGRILHNRIGPNNLCKTLEDVMQLHGVKSRHVFATPGGSARQIPNLPDHPLWQNPHAHASLPRVCATPRVTGRTCDVKTHTLVRSY